MRILIFLPVFYFFSVSGMEIPNDPAELIRRYIQRPEVLQEQLQMYPQKGLMSFRDSKYNNALHLLAKELTAQQRILNSHDYKELEERSKPLFTYLVKIGIDINEVNDDRDTPYCYADNRFAEDILVDLGAKQTYVSIAPEMRSFRKFLKKLCCCECLRKRKEH